MDEESFITQFEDVPKVTIFSGREVDQQLNQIRETIADANKPWDKRVESVSSQTQDVNSYPKSNLGRICYN